jgi:thioredoxin reductase (NADPH)
MVIIVGAGPIGLACGIELKKRNIPHLILEKGCLVNSLYQYPVNMTFFSTAERIELGNVPFIAQNVKPTRREALEYYRRVAHFFDLNIKTYEPVVSVAQDLNGFEVISTKGTYHAKTIILATGFFTHANLMHIPGEELPKVRHYYDEPHPYSKQKVVVVGAGNSAVDVALETFRAGAQVTLVVREDRIKDSVKYWVKPDIENRIKDGEIKAFFHSQLTHIGPNSVTISGPNGVFELENDFVLAMTGYRPDYSLLEKAGIRIGTDEHQTPFFDEETFETNVPGLFLAGVVCGGLNTGKWFIENARYHAERIADAVRLRN